MLLKYLLLYKLRKTFLEQKQMDWYWQLKIYLVWVEQEKLNISMSCSLNTNNLKKYL